MAQPINSLEPLTINGVKQWVQLQASDSTQPVLLILHGGPGYAIMPLFHARNAALEDSFIVVNWDQRGAGRSYSRRIPRSSMTLRQLLDDLQALTLYLKERFRQEKIYLLGHSFGTMLGLSAARDHPENYHAYVGVGQVVGPIVNEIVMYEWALQQAGREKNSKALRQLRRIGHPDEDGEYLADGPGGEAPYDTAERWMGYFGGELYQKRGSDEIDDWLLGQPVYQGKWGRKWEKGLTFSARIFEDPAAWRLDFRESARSVDVPVYFLQGHHDYDTPWPLVAEYAPILAAPRRELIWFENSAHFPFYEEPDLFNEVLVTVVKGDTYPRRGRP
jgi:pimeloyl-ACP methyl ester carboxylesterase